jgi:hypothetical protein
MLNRRGFPTGQGMCVDRLRQQITFPQPFDRAGKGAVIVRQRRGLMRVVLFVGHMSTPVKVENSHRTAKRLMKPSSAGHRTLGFEPSSPRPASSLATRGEEIHK